MMDDMTLNFPPIEEIEQMVAEGRLTELQAQLERIHPADIALLLDELETETAVTVFELLSIEIASEVLDETGGQIRQELVEKVDDERLADLLDELPMDDAAEFLEDLPDEISDRLIGLMEPEEAAEVQELLAYEDETAGRLMNRDVVALRRQWTVNETFDYLRSLEDAETLHYLYVVDRDNKLIGVVPLRRLILSQPDQTIESLMYSDVASVPVTADLAKVFSPRWRVVDAVEMTVDASEAMTEARSKRVAWPVRDQDHARVPTRPRRPAARGGVGGGSSTLVTLAPMELKTFVLRLAQLQQ